MSLVMHGGKITADEARGAREGLRAMGMVLLSLAAAAAVAIAIAGTALLLADAGHVSEHRAPAVTARS